MLMTGPTFETMTKLLDVRYVNVLEGLCNVNKLEDVRSSKSLDRSIEGEPTRRHGDVSGLGWTLPKVNKLEDM